jgi:hypothetical protein
MLHRLSQEGLICITQPNHAWVSGQLARAWGNEHFGQVVPAQEVYLGAEQHDIGWLNWEEAPTLNSKTGYPHRFSELPTQLHVDIWSSTQQRAKPLGRYAALLISLHGTRLYERFTGWKHSPESAQIVQAFLDREYSFQEQLTESLKNDPYYAPHMTPEVIKRNRRLVATWDALSLIVCQNWLGDQQVEQVPVVDGETTLKLININDDPHLFTVSPWPFQESKVTVVYEGRLLREPFTDETAMREALKSDCWVTLSTTLKPE